MKTYKFHGFTLVNEDKKVWYAVIEDGRKIYAESKKELISKIGY